MWNQLQLSFEWLNDNERSNKLVRVVHSVGRLIVGVDGVLVSQLFGPRSLLMHVRPAHQLGSKMPTFSSRQFYVHGYIAIGFLQNKKSRHLWDQIQFIQTIFNQINYGAKANVIQKVCFIFVTLTSKLNGLQAKIKSVALYHFFNQAERISWDDLSALFYMRAGVMNKKATDSWKRG